MDVVLYVLDSLRPDFLGCYGHEFDTSPNIDSFADDAVRFENAYSTSNWTKPAAASIVTGRYPQGIHVEDESSSLPPESSTLAEKLASQGFDAVGATANTFVSEKFGFDRGFRTLKNLELSLNPEERHTRSSDSIDDSLVVPESPDLNEFVYDSASDADDRFFLLWSVDTHNPYFVRGDESWFGNDDTVVNQSELSDFVADHGCDALHSLYRDMIRYNDEYFGEFLDWLRRSGRYDESLIVVLGDHGEAFGEHGQFGHNELLYDEEVQIPLLVKFPENTHAGTSVGCPVSIVDIYETVLESTGAETDERTDGQPLQTVLSSGVREGVVSMHDRMSQPYSTGYRWENYKYIDVDYPLIPADASPRALLGRLLDLWTVLRWRTPTLFDLEEDPGEMSPLPDSQMPDEMRAAIQTFTSRIERQRSEHTPTERDPRIDAEHELEDKLRPLGYVE